jgi:hypothetical protein
MPTRCNYNIALLLNIQINKVLKDLLLINILYRYVEEKDNSLSIILLIATKMIFNPIVQHKKNRSQLAEVALRKVVNFWANLVVICI